jgi:hypothetical protein
MKIATTLLLLALSTLPATAGNWFGSGPWANGAYYPGQFDGRYTATIYNNLNSTNIPVTGTNTAPEYVSTGVVSGVLGFGIRNGMPSTAATANNNTAANSANQFASSFTTQSVVVDTSHNYFITYIDGKMYAGQTAGNIDINQNKVSGTLLNGTSTAGFERVNITTVVGTNATGTPIIATTPSFIAVPGGVAGGFFSANITKNRGVFAFSGPGKISTQSVTSSSGTTNPPPAGALLTYPFSLDGMRVSFDTRSGYVTSGTTAGN